MLPRKIKHASLKSDEGRASKGKWSAGSNGVESNMRLGNWLLGLLTQVNSLLSKCYFGETEAWLWRFIKYFGITPSFHHPVPLFSCFDWPSLPLFAFVGSGVRLSESDCLAVSHCPYCRGSQSMVLGTLGFPRLLQGLFEVKTIFVKIPGHQLPYHSYSLTRIQSCFPAATWCAMVSSSDT